MISKPDIAARLLRPALTGKAAAFFAVATAVTGVTGVGCMVAAAVCVGGRERYDLLAANPLHGLAISLFIAGNVGKSWVTLGLAASAPKGCRAVAWVAAGMLLFSQLLLNLSDVMSTRAGAEWCYGVVNHFAGIVSPTVMADGILSVCLLYSLDTLEIFGACVFAVVLWRASRTGRFTAWAFLCFALWSCTDLFITLVSSSDITLVSESMFALSEGAICVCAARQFWQDAGPRARRARRAVQGAATGTSHAINAAERRTGTPAQVTIQCFPQP